MEGNAKFQLEVSENKGVGVFLPGKFANRTHRTHGQLVGVVCALPVKSLRIKLVKICMLGLGVGIFPEVCGLRGVWIPKLIRTKSSKKEVGVGRGWESRAEEE